MVENVNEKTKIGNMKKRKMNKWVKFVLVFLVIALMIIFFVYVTIRYIKHPEKVPFLIGCFKLLWEKPKRNDNDEKD